MPNSAFKATKFSNFYIPEGIITWMINPPAVVQPERIVSVEKPSKL